ncbi:transmembrane protein 275 [Denticeps clupeoides]|uniref:transmembrane protein 275 n=1 Tax=Denticeps clupeoides TaxID=299321 RepID=UPI0010A44848|nr:transmembrane protein 275-like [Denticeps clupeoides]
MVGTDSTSMTRKNPPQGHRRRTTRPQGIPSPALCCACGLCIMLAGINTTLVGAFAFSTLLPANNPPIVIGPVLLLVAFSFFGACCICSRLPPPRSGRSKSGQGHGEGGVKRGRLGGGVAFEFETSEPTLQDTTAVQLSPTDSPCSSPSSSPGCETRPPDDPAADPAPLAVVSSTPTSQAASQLFTMDANGPESASAYFSSNMGGSGGGSVQLALPCDIVT